MPNNEGQNLGLAKPLRTGSVLQAQIQPDLFPFDAWEFDTTAALLYLRTNWRLRSFLGSELDYHNLTALTTPADDDEFPIWDQNVPEYKRITYANLVAALTVSLGL